MARTLAAFCLAGAVLGFRSKKSSWGSCETFGCFSDYDRKLPCQCNSNCGKYKNCCSDFYPLCKGSDAPPPPPPPVQTTPSPTPPSPPPPPPPSYSPQPSPLPPPTGDAVAYWAGVDTTNKGAVKSRIRSGVRRISYGGLWTAYKSVWVGLPGKCSSGGMFDIYSAKCWTPGSEQCGTFRKEGDCYNREHSWPKSWWGGSKNDAYSDMFHVMPSDGYVNGRRSNHEFGEVGNVKYTSSDGHKTGSCSAGTCFEPKDSIKGLVARGHLWVNFRYGYDLSGSYLALMLKWHSQHPPEAWERELNNRIQDEQGNRNPFIDFPSLANSFF